MYTLYHLYVKIADIALLYNNNSNIHLQEYFLV
jgi:hypothetical protein